MACHVQKRTAIAQLAVAIASSDGHVREPKAKHSSTYDLEESILGEELFQKICLVRQPQCCAHNLLHLVPHLPTQSAGSMSTALMLSQQASLLQPLVLALASQYEQA